MRIATVAVATCGVLLLLPATYAQLKGKDIEVARKMVEGKFFMHLDAPCGYGAKTAAGLWFDPMLEVSPTGHKLLPEPTLPHKQYVYWGSGPNDPVGYGTIKVKGETVYVWLEGRKPAANEFAIAFVNIKTLDDFKAAYNRTFSAVPLEEAHPEWPAEVRKAVGAHDLIEGMTKEQAFCVVGEPATTETSVENGVPVEIWHPRQENGHKQPYHNMKPEITGYPVTLKFVNDKLVAVEQPAAKRK